MKRLREELGAGEVYFFGSRVYGVPLKDSDPDMGSRLREIQGAELHRKHGIT